MLATVRVRSSVYCLSELREPWGFEVDGANVAKFHLVLAGSCWLNLPGTSLPGSGPVIWSYFPTVSGTS